MTLDGIKLRLRNSYIRLTANIRRRKIKNPEFTIISNNCWAGLVYESYNLPKQTPTAGMYFMADEYIKFVSNLKHYTSCKMTFVKPEDARHKDFYAKDKRFGSFPIARLEDIEIAMLHFHSEEEAKEKWERRCERIHWDRMLVKMNDQNGCKYEHVKKFCKLPLKNKLFITVRNDWVKNAQNLAGGGTRIAYIPSRNKDCCGLFDEKFGASKYMNVNEIVNQIG